MKKQITKKIDEELNSEQKRVSEEKNSVKKDRFQGIGTKKQVRNPSSKPIKMDLEKIEAEEKK